MDIRPADTKTSAEKVNAFELADRKFFRMLYFGTKNPVFDVLMPFMSVAANRGLLHTVVSLALVVAGCFLKDDGYFIRAGILTMAATAIAGTLAEGTIKFFWKRKRPFQVMEDVAAAVNAKRLQRRPSFPSGHAAGYLAATTTIALCFPGPVAWIALTIGILGAYSRIYNGVHFPTDVLAGATVGILCAVAIASIVPAHIPPIF